MARRLFLQEPSLGRGELRRRGSDHTLHSLLRIPMFVSQLPAFLLHGTQCQAPPRGGAWRAFSSSAALSSASEAHCSCSAHHSLATACARLGTCSSPRPPPALEFQITRKFQT